jgi:hypothetical protein
VDRNENGTIPIIGQCAKCAQGFYPAQDLSRCLACPDTVNMVAFRANNSMIYECRCKTQLGFRQTPVYIFNLRSPEFAFWSHCWQPQAMPMGQVQERSC